MERGVLSSRKTIVVLTPEYIKSGWTEFERLMVQTLSPANRDLCILPVLRKKCILPPSVSYMTYVNLADSDDEKLEWSRLIASITPYKEPSLSIPRQPRKLSEREDAFQNEAKILIVGEGSVGKTSLIRRLLLNKFDANEFMTDGIVINRLQVDERWGMTDSYRKNDIRRSKLQLNIWDFGGQEIMHATHQFFLTKRSLYLLVLDARLTQEENRVEYWLKMIESFGGDSPVLIVGNKTDQFPLDIDRVGLQRKYPNIAGILETSAYKSIGIEELKLAIRTQVNNLPHFHKQPPAKWFSIKTIIEKLGQENNFIVHDDYVKLCEEKGIRNKRSQQSLISFLHDLGVVLYFEDDPRLESLGILNPQWVTNGVYKILNSHELFQNHGILTLPLLNSILNLPEYPSNKRLFIVDLMKKFELCYDIEFNISMQYCPPASSHAS